MNWKSHLLFHKNIIFQKYLAKSDTTLTFMMDSYQNPDRIVRISKDTVILTICGRCYGCLARKVTLRDLNMDCAGCSFCSRQTSPFPPTLEPFQVDKSDTALLICSIRNTVCDFKRNLKFTTRLEHQINIPNMSKEIYCLLLSHSVVISNNRTINNYSKSVISASFALKSIQWGSLFL